MEPLAWIALAGLLVGIVSSVVTNNTNVRLTEDTNRSNQQIQRETNDLQRELAAQSNQWSLDQWNRENAYNTPVNQMQRLTDAGVNPMLAVSNGSLVNEAASSPAVNMANVEAMRNIAPKIDNPVDPVVASNVALQSAQIERLDTQNYKDLQLLPFQTESIQSATDLSRSLVGVNEQSIRESVSRISLNEASQAKLTEETKQYALNNQYLSDTLADREKMVFNQRVISDTDVKYFEDKCKQGLAESRALVLKYRAEAKASLAKSDLDTTEREYISKQVDNYERTIENLEAQSKHLNSMSSLNDAETELKKKYGPRKAEQEIRRLRQERITGWVNAYTSGVRDIGVGLGSVLRGVSSFAGN